MKSKTPDTKVKERKLIEIGPKITIFDEYPQILTIVPEFSYHLYAINVVILDKKYLVVFLLKNL